MKKWYTIRVITHDWGIIMKNDLTNNIDDFEFDFDESSYNDTSSDIVTTCLNCGFTEKVPDFIYDECSRKIYHFKIKKKVSTLTCQKCGKDTAIPSSFLQK